MSELTYKDLQNTLTPQDYKTLTLADTAVAERCLAQAKLVIKSVIMSTGNTYDENDEYCRMCVLKRGRIELYLFNGQKDFANSEQSDLELILKTKYGSIITKNDTSSDTTGPAVAEIQPPNRNPLDTPYGR